MELEQLKRASCVAWIDTDKIVNENGQPIDLNLYYYLQDLYFDRAKEIVVKKSAQSGVSTWAILDGLHKCRYWGINQIHTLPTVTDAKTFVQSKVNKIIEQNKCLKSKVSKRDSDSVGQKQMGKGFLFYRGTIGKTSGIMITADRNIHDELDFSDMENIRTYQTRQYGEASLKMNAWISTPTFPDYGIDEKWEESDQKHMRFNCPHCGLRQHMDWEQSVDMDQERYRCWECDGTIDNTKFPEWYALSEKGDKHHKIDMRWEARYPDREMSGYWINQMLLGWKPASELIKEYRELTKKGDSEHFWNFNLGLPYQESETKVTEGMFTKNLSDEDANENDSIMGIDVQQNELYCIIGNMKGQIYGITRCQDKREGGKLVQSKWDRAGELVEAHGVKTCVIDATYKPNDVLAFAERYPYIVIMNWYGDAQKGKKPIRYAEDRKFTDKTKLEFSEEIKVLTDRLRIIDRLVADLNHGHTTFLYNRHDPDFMELIKQSTRMYSVIVEDEHTKEKKREWRATGQNDYFHALVYFKIAQCRGLYTD